MYSLSTCWNSHRHADGRSMLREIRDLGFRHAELSHGIRAGLVPGILEAVDAGEIKISSLHNFCPLPLGVNHAAPNLYEFSDERPRERELAVKHTLKTFDFAVRVGAPLVVLHLGRIEMKDYTGKLGAMLEREGTRTPKYEKLRAAAVKARDTKKAKPFERTLRALRQLLPEAEKRGLKLGCENRQAIEELPAEDDFRFLFQELSSAGLCYWHDTGHGQIKENLGILHVATHLKSLRDRLAGFHVHDVEFPIRDHAAPGTGGIDFAALKPFIQPSHAKVFELSPSLKTDAVHAAVAHVKATWGSE
ncbi:MAG: sugar phosphate isomerase/epimerase [Verrucomicrobia bacterium]|nr:sugar phosphate isomerase/epimerase [Verrucomicrobiota bacterium]MDE3098522.1 sugar phosphate isomerase/epimerase [Verrucomicrobiota bacterium]